jgi:hypothetical protein
MPERFIFFNSTGFKVGLDIGSYWRKKPGHSSLSPSSPSLEEACLLADDLPSLRLPLESRVWAPTMASALAHDLGFWALVTWSPSIVPQILGVAAYLQVVTAFLDSWVFSHLSEQCVKFSLSETSE